MSLIGQELGELPGPRLPLAPKAGCLLELELELLLLVDGLLVPDELSAPLLVEDGAGVEGSDSAGGAVV